MRLIDADTLKETLVIMANIFGGSLDIIDVSNAIEKTPTVDLPHGEWKVIHNALGETKYQCNQCQHYVNSGDDKNFCPNCGSDNRPKEGDSN